MAFAKRGVGGGRRGPPVKWNGRSIRSDGLRREEERKTSHKEAKPPIWKSKMATVMRTSTTLGVVKTARVEGRDVLEMGGVREEEEEEEDSLRWRFGP